MKKRPFFPHKKLGFQRNPFSALAKQEWCDTAFLPSQLSYNFLESQSHLQLIGQVGSGKSSLLHYGAAILQTNGLRVRYEYIPEGQRRFLSDLGEVDLFLLDEAQRLSWWEKRRWLRWAALPRKRTLFATHQDLSGWFGKRGLILTLFDVETAVSPQTYAQWLNTRLNYFALTQPPAVQFTPESSQFLFETFGADIRAAEYFLYEVFQDLETAVLITPAILTAAMAKYQPKIRSPRHG